MRVKECVCGSGKSRYELRDAAGTFCTFVCEDCEDARKATFNPRIFDTSSNYASSGEERDLVGDDGDWL